MRASVEKIEVKYELNLLEHGSEHPWVLGLVYSREGQWFLWWFLLWLLNIPSTKMLLNVPRVQRRSISGDPEELVLFTSYLHPV